MEGEGFTRSYFDVKTKRVVDYRCKWCKRPAWISIKTKDCAACRNQLAQRKEGGGMEPQFTITAAQAEVGKRYWTVNGYPVDILEKGENGAAYGVCKPMRRKPYRFHAEHLFSTKPVSPSLDAQRDMRRAQTEGRDDREDVRDKAERRERVMAAAEATGRKVEAETGRDRRLPKPGTILSRGDVKVKVLEKGFEYNGTIYKSLSSVAREVTGKVWNGFAFFNLN